MSIRRRKINAGFRLSAFAWLPQRVPHLRLCFSETAAAVARNKAKSPGTAVVRSLNSSGPVP